MGKSRKYRVTNKKYKRSIKVAKKTSTEVTQELINMLGEPGVPNDDPVLDCLGRKIKDNVPDYLKRSAVTKDTKIDTKEKPPLDRKVTLVKDSTLTYPPLCFKVFVQPDPAVGAALDEARFAKMFARSQCRRAPSVLEADLVVFSGGSDVDPQLYGEKPHPSVYVSHQRDETDMALYVMCLEHGIPMLGICRGAQFLHVMNGGKLFQDVDGHNGSHAIWDILGKQRIEKISSVHHQMVRPNTDNGMEIIATAAKSNVRYVDANHKMEGSHLDIEAFFYRDTCCVGIQGHPEYEGYNYFTQWCLKLLDQLVFQNPDLEWSKETGALRMKKDLLDQRNSTMLANLLTNAITIVKEAK